MNENEKLLRKRSIYDVQQLTQIVELSRQKSGISKANRVSFYGKIKNDPQKVQIIL